MYFSCSSSKSHVKSTIPENVVPPHPLLSFLLSSPDYANKNMSRFFPFLTPVPLSLSPGRRRALRKGKQKRGVISLGTLPSEDRPSMPYNETHDSLIHGVRASPRNDHHTLIPALNLTVSAEWIGGWLCMYVCVCEENNNVWCIF